jgi:hypothetical protein
VTSIGDLRAAVVGVRERVKAERDVVAVSEAGMHVASAHLHHLWRGSQDEGVRVGAVCARDTIYRIEKTVEWCDAVLDQLDRYEKSL